MNREAAVSGMFIPFPIELRKTIAEMVDEDAVKEDAIGLIIRRGYVYSET